MIKNPKFFLKFFLLALSAAATSSDKDVRQVANFQVAILLPLSGELKDEAKKYEEGFKMAEVDLKTQKTPIEIHFIDTKSSTEECARLFIEENKKKTDLIISPFSGWCLPKAIELSQNLKQATISLNKYPLLVEKKSSFLIHFSTHPDRYPQAMAIFAKESLKAESVAVVSEIGNQNSWKNAQTFKESWKKLSGKNLSESSISFSPLDTNSIVENAKKNKWKFVYFSSDEVKSAALIKAINDSGLKVTFLGDPSWESESFYKVPSESLAGNFFPIDYFSQDPDRYNLDTLEKYSKFLNKKTPSAAMALAFDSIMWVKEAVVKDRLQWWSLLEKMQDIPCLSHCEKINNKFYMERKITILSTQRQRSRFQSTL